VEAYYGLRQTDERSVTTPSSKDSINQIVNKDTLIIGTRTPYGIFHQSDEARNTLPLRKFLFIGPEARKFATSAQIGRLQRWLGIMEAYLEEVVEE